MDLSLQDGVKGHRERSLKQGRAIRVWNGGSLQRDEGIYKGAMGCAAGAGRINAEAGENLASNMFHRDNARNRL